MFPTVVRCSKASRRPLTSKRGGKDFYKGSRQAFLPGGHRTGAPGKFVPGTSIYRLDDEKVRVFVAPPIKEIRESSLKAYVHTGVKINYMQNRDVYGKLPRGGLTGAHLLNLARKPPPEKTELPSTTSE